MFLEEEEEKIKLMIKLPRLVLGFLAASLAIFLYVAYFGFLKNEEIALIFRLLVFNFGQLICLILIIWAGVLISKNTLCPKCKEGHLIFPVAELNNCLPTLPFSFTIISSFRLNKKESLFVKDSSGKLAGSCPCCGAKYYYENNQLELRYINGDRHD